MQVTPVGVGTAPIGSGRDWPVWWGPQDEAESIRTIHTALDFGVNWIDTAPFYGWGRAEEIVGRALRGRDEVLVFSKCGTLPDEARGDRMDLSPESIAPTSRRVCAGCSVSGSICCSFTMSTAGRRSR